MRWSILMLILILGSGSFATGSGPADDLLRLVPVDPGFTLVVEDLRDHAREIRQ